MAEWIEALHAVGMWSTTALWLPLLVWTALAFPLYSAVRRARAGHPLVRYRLLQGLLFTLPVGLVAAAWIDISGWLALWPTLAPASPSPSSPLLLPVEGASGASAAPADGLELGVYHATGLFTLMAGSLGVARLIRLARSRRAVARLHTQTAPDTGTAQRIATRLARDLGVRRPVHVELTGEAVVPLTYGTRRPVILLPRSLADEPEALKMTLTHELIHVRRHDFFARWAEQVIAAVFAIHPGLSWLTRAIERAREMACDAEALRHLRGHRKAYADLLFSFSTATPSHAVGVVSIAETSSSLKERIHAMTRLDLSALKRPRYASALALMLIAGLGLGIVACSDAVTPPNATESTPETATAQSEDASDGPVFVVVEDRPTLKGGMEALQEAIHYPTEAKDAGIEGRVFVQFIVDENGDTINPHVTRGAHDLLNKAAMEAIERMQFEPGKQRGQAVKVQMSIPVTFKLPKEDATTTRSANQGASQTEAGPLEANNRRMSFEQLRFDGDTVTGRVVDAATGQPLAGTNIHVPNTNKGSVTGSDGSFTLRAKASSIVASFVGYESIEAQR